MASTIADVLRPIEVRPRTLSRAEQPGPSCQDPLAWNSFYADLYRGAQGVAEIPWANLKPCPALVAWLNAEAPALIRPGASVAVVGCGLGDDVREVFSRGYDVIGFDISPRAIDWARERHPEVSDRLIVGDVFDLPRNLMRRHDLVIEIYTIQSVAPALRERVAAGVVSLARPRGVVLTICRGRDECEPLDSLEGPPFPLSCAELKGLFEGQGFAPMHEPDDFLDDEDPPQRRVRAAFRRAN
jgi:SAM-dependent methyltransferase